MTTQMKALDEYFLMVVFTLLLSILHVFANFMFHLNRETWQWKKLTKLVFLLQISSRTLLIHSVNCYLMYFQTNWKKQTNKQTKPNRNFVSVEGWWSYPMNALAIPNSLQPNALTVYLVCGCWVSTAPFRANFTSIVSVRGFWGKSDWSYDLCIWNICNIMRLFYTPKP